MAFFRRNLRENIDEVGDEGEDDDVLMVDAEDERTLGVDRTEAAEWSDVWRAPSDG
jgi:hypothetical protein